MGKKIVLFVVYFVIILFCVEIGEVKAEDNRCETYTNYYLFLDASTKSLYFNSTFENSNNASISRETTTQEYNLRLPNGARKIDEGLVSFSDNSTSIDNMSLDDFYDYWVESNQGIYNDGNINYIRGSGWFENGEFHDDSEELYADFIDRVPENYGHPEIVMEGTSNTVQLTINRTWEQDEIDALEKDLVYSPAVYYVQYQVCEEYKVTVHYMDDYTDKELFNTVIYEGLADGEEYDSYTCPSKLDDYASYSLNKNKQYQYVSGAIDGEDIDLYCYYDKKVTLTVNYGTNNDCSEGSNIRKSDTSEQIVGQNIRYTIPSEFTYSDNKYEFSNVGVLSPTFNTKISSNVLNFEMPNKNASVCLVYVKNPQTGIGWIYFAWIVGVIAFGYSAWYFVKYYKNQNNEI